MCRAILSNEYLQTVTNETSSIGEFGVGERIASVAALFCRDDSVYKLIEGVDVWDISRNALLWPGGAPIVAHPPCRAWGQLSHMAKPAQGEKELAVWAIEQIRQFGGVLEHPRASRLWPEMNLPKSGAGSDKFGGWSIGIHQYWFGHRAQKSTLLYIVGCEPVNIPIMPIVLGDAKAVVSQSGRHADGSKRSTRPWISKADRERTPVNLAWWLVELARRCDLTRR